MKWAYNLQIGWKGGKKQNIVILNTQENCPG
jgi:hypothetical protein